MNLGPKRVPGDTTEYDASMSPRFSRSTYVRRANEDLGHDKVIVTIFTKVPLALTTRARLGFLEYMSACVYPRQAGDGTQSAICTLACMDKRTQKCITCLTLRMP